MLLDSNILIYSVLPAYPQLRALVADKTSAVSAITDVEVLGFHMLRPAEKLDLEKLFAAIAILPLLHGLTLSTRNVRNFAWVSGLTVHDPLGP